jgi:hypothetical protein
LSSYVLLNEAAAAANPNFQDENPVATSRKMAWINTSL